MTEEEFVETLNKAFRNPADAPFLGRLPDKVLPRKMKNRDFETPPLVTAVNTPRYAFPLSLKMSKSFASHRMALIGDASRRVHPLAGQGLNLGFSDVAYLSNAVLKSKKGGADIGDYGFTLSEFEKQAMANSYAVAGSIEFVKRAYGPDVAGNEVLGHVLAGARNFGIDVIESSDFLKHNFQQFASGNVMHPAKYQWVNHH